MEHRKVNGYKVLAGILATILAGLLVVTFTLIFDKSGRAYDLALHASQTSAQNRQDVAVIKEQLSAISEKLDERTKNIEEKIEELKRMIERLQR